MFEKYWEDDKPETSLISGDGKTFSEEALKREELFEKYHTKVFLTVDGYKYGLPEGFSQLVSEHGWVRVVDSCFEGVYCITVKFKEYKIIHQPKRIKKDKYLGETESDYGMEKTHVSYQIAADEVVVRVHYYLHIVKDEEALLDNKLMNHKDAVYPTNPHLDEESVKYYTESGLVLPKDRHPVLGDFMSEELLHPKQAEIDLGKLQEYKSRNVSYTILEGFVGAEFYAIELKKYIPDMMQVFSEETMNVWKD